MRGMQLQVFLRKILSPKSLWGFGLVVISIVNGLGDIDTALKLPNMVSTLWGFVESPYGYWLALALGIAWLGWIGTRSTEPPRTTPTLDSLAADGERFSERVEKIDQALVALTRRVDYNEKGPLYPRGSVELCLLSFESTNDNLEAHLRFTGDVKETIAAVHMEISGEVLDAESFEPFDFDTDSTKVVRFHRPSWLVDGDYEAHIYADGNRVKGWGKQAIHSLTITL